MRRMYSENQIVKVLEDKDVKVKTIEQSEANWEQDLDLTNLYNLPTGLTVTNVYSKIIQWNRELHIIFNFKINNPTENQISGFNSSTNNIDIPANIAERIIDFSGKNATEASTAPICAGVYNTGTTSYPASLEASFKSFLLKNTGTANRIALAIQDIYAINAGTSLYISGRISIDLA